MTNIRIKYINYTTNNLISLFVIYYHNNNNKLIDNNPNIKNMCSMLLRISLTFIYLFHCTVSLCEGQFRVGQFLNVCVPCQDTNCNWCTADFAKCVECSDSYGVFQDQCSACTSFRTGCLTCNTDALNCLSCSKTYKHAGNTCIPCTVTNCDNCLADVNKCASCLPGYVLDNPTSCILCSTLAGGYMIDGIGDCFYCKDLHCMKCPSDVQICT